MKAFLILEDGHVFKGTSIGSTRDVISEIVFNTSMTGYLEVMTDPSYAGQAVCMTYPLIGNYGICYDDQESSKPWVDGFIVRELSRVPSNFRSVDTIQHFLEEQDIPGISGIDTRGSEIINTRSDVNIIAVVNPTTHQILLITTPRDYYIPIPGISDGMNDKLTHAGTYGIDVSMETLGALYETDINYYVRLNFSSLIEIVDILGGVDVYSEYAFTTGWESGYEMEVQQGINHFDGKQALAFSRERHALEGGDNQRGKNQQAVITAMLKKVLSPTMLLKANSIINQVSQDVETNISQGQLNSLVKSQLKSGAKWTIQSVAASGTDGEDYCYSVPDMPLYVLYPDEEVVNSIVELANIVEEGGSLESGEALN